MSTCVLVVVEMLAVVLAGLKLFLLLVVSSCGTGSGSSCGSCGISG